MKNKIFGLVIIILLGVSITMGVFVNALMSDVKDLKNEYDKAQEVIVNLEEENKELKEEVEELTHTVNMLRMFQ